MKQGLVIEGGGMRGAHSCGALMALAAQDRKHFDVVVAASAGACSAAFFVAEQFDLLPVVWTKYLHDGRFINFAKVLRGDSVLDLDYLIHVVFRDLEPLNVEAIRSNPTDFFVAATDCESGTTRYFHNHKDPILNAIKASAAMPIAYRHPVVVDGRSYVDGGVADPIPIQKALDEGCEEIILLLTREPGYRKKLPLVDLLPRVYQKKYPKLAEAFQRRYAVYNNLLERIERKDFPCRLTVVRPSEKLPITRLKARRDKIRAALDQGYRDALAALLQD